MQARRNLVPILLAVALALGAADRPGGASAAPAPLAPAAPTHPSSLGPAPGPTLGPAPGPTPAPSPAAAPAGPPDFAALAARLLPAVVNIAATIAPRRRAATIAPRTPGRHAAPQADRSGIGPAFHRFMQGKAPPPAPGSGSAQSLGSGFLIAASGLIVTNDHVIAGARRILVILHDQTVLRARLVGRDRTGDLALLQVDAGHKLPFVRWGDSASVPVGAWVLAIGNPFGLGGTVTAGIVSARGRDIHDGIGSGFIQTDAPINRGNSGGPLFDMQGRVIGVNTAIYAPSGGSIGIGFAIPAAFARPDIAELRRDGRIRRGWLGVDAQAVTGRIAGALGLPHAGGALVAGVAPGGPAAAAGLRPGDVIRAIGATPLDAEALPRLLASLPPGRTLDLKVRRAGSVLRLTVRLGEMPVAPARRPAPAQSLGRLPAIVTPRSGPAAKP